MATTIDDQLDATLDALGDGFSQGEPADTATIRNWIDILEEAGDQSLRSLSGDLQRLESILDEDTIDPVALQEVLASLGDQTTTAAGKASGLTEEKLRQLGQDLTDAADSLDTDVE